MTNPPPHNPTARPTAPVYALTEKGPAGREALEVYLHVEAVQDILAAVPSGARYETGGLLAGVAAQDERGPYVLILRALSAPSAHSERLSLTFTPEAWEELWAAHERECPDLKIVGWYHTHPGLGVFLSEPDQFIHRHFFSDPGQIALVFDPADFRWGVFYWVEGGLRAAEGLYLYSEAARSYPQLEDSLHEIAPEWIILHGPEGPKEPNHGPTD
ncbi:MAG TPA: Mov34/MPN/PAD-1 family protein [Armatimonadota bacterium]|jgi:proteasome lid subunit RPN8/RPN11